MKYYIIYYSCLRQNALPWDDLDTMMEINNMAEGMVSYPVDGGVHLTGMFLQSVK